MSKTLVAYFSATGVTAGVAQKIAMGADADLFEIVPAQKYTTADLDWHNENSRSSIEMKGNRSFRPAIASKVENMIQYDTIYIGFPIWWYVAPTIINTFLESYDFSGKTIHLFATSGMSGMGNTVDELKPSAPNAVWGKADRLGAMITQSEVDEWIKK